MIQVCQEDEGFKYRPGLCQQSRDRVEALASEIMPLGSLSAGPRSSSSPPCMGQSTCAAGVSSLKTALSWRILHRKGVPRGTPG